MSLASDYNPIWDRTRARAADPGRVFGDRKVMIATDFEGGNGTAICAIGTDHYQIDLEPEPGEHRFQGVAYYLCFAIRNLRRKEARVTVRLRAKVHRNEKFHDHRHMIVRRGGHWSHLPVEAIRPVAQSSDILDLDLALPAAGTPDDLLFISNFHWWPYSEVIAYVRSLSGVRVREIGRSIQGRPILAVEIGTEDPAAPCILQAQTSQASEMMAAHACRWLIDFLLDGSEETRRLRQRFRFCIVPAANPDGAVLGHGVSDARGGFPHFEANRAAEGDPDASPENIALWRYVEQCRPWLFWEWHSNNWFRRPGHVLIRIRHHLAQDPVQRAAWDAIEKKLLALPNTYHEMWNSTGEGVSQDTPPYQASLRLGSIGCLIKQHERFSLDESRRHAVACLRAAVAAYPGSRAAAVSP